MNIVLVQPTELSPRAMTDYWDVVNDDVSADSYYDKLENVYFCKYDTFKSFDEAEVYLMGTATSRGYKDKMFKGLGELKDTASILNWAVV